jgi:hypothetical protein
MTGGTTGTDPWGVEKLKQAMTRCGVTVVGLDEALRPMRKSSQRVQQLLEI